MAEGSTGDQEERIDQLLKEKQEHEEALKELEERISDAEGLIITRLIKWV